MPENSAAQVDRHILALARQEPYGVRGWLLFFCLATTIFTPLLTLGRLSTLAQPNIWTLLRFVIAAFSMVAGINLWRVSQKAIAILRAYFIFLVAFEVYTFVYNYTVLGLHDVLHDLALAARGLLSVGIWTLYFHLSDRVKNTYGVNL
jgi:hypothetical protein